MALIGLVDTAGQVVTGKEGICCSVPAALPASLVTSRPGAVDFNAGPAAYDVAEALGGGRRLRLDW